MTGPNQVRGDDFLNASYRRKPAPSCDGAKVSSVEDEVEGHGEIITQKERMINSREFLIHNS